MHTVNSKLENILNRLQQGHTVEKEEIIYLLGLSDPSDIKLLFQAARDVRARHSGNTVFLYGFLYFSTFCRNNCNFCQYRQSNSSLSRYRKTNTQILSAATEMADTGVHLIDLTMGEDPDLYFGEPGYDQLVHMVESVQKKTGLPLMISPGVLPDRVIRELASLGVTWYACYQETHNRTLYKELRQGQGFHQRLAKKQLAKNLGMLIEEGILTGVGETLDDLAESITWMKAFGVDQARVMTFVPQVNTPMAGIPAQGSLKERLIIGVMRLVLQDVLIPASLDVNGLSGLKARLNAGANVVTSIVPPQKGLAGVANNSLDIDDSRRSLKHVLPVIKECGLEAAQQGDYLFWVSQRKNILAHGPQKKEKEVE
ncbi:MAG: methylornithine synthase PylB [Desulforhopalus sp.]